MYNEKKVYSVRTLVLVHVLNFQRDLVGMRLIRIELTTCSTSKVDRVKVHTHTHTHTHIYIYIYIYIYIVRDVT